MREVPPHLVQNVALARTLAGLDFKQVFLRQLLLSRTLAQRTQGVVVSCAQEIRPPYTSDIDA